MKKNNIYYTIVVIIILIAIGLFFIFKGSNTSGQSTDQNQVATTTATTTSALDDSAYDTTDIVAPNGTIHAFIADTDQKMELGLSNRDSIAADGGMIFEFDTAGSYEFWMKDMRFPLDIVWIDVNKNVLGVVANLSPDSYPNTVLPPSDIGYVLELPAGAAATLGIATGTALTF